MNTDCFLFWRLWGDKGASDSTINLHVLNIFIYISISSYILLFWVSAFLLVYLLSIHHPLYDLHSPHRCFQTRSTINPWSSDDLAGCLLLIRWKTEKWASKACFQYCLVNRIGLVRDVYLTRTPMYTFTLTHLRCFTISFIYILQEEICMLTKREMKELR